MHERGLPCLLVLAGMLLVGCEDTDSLVGELAVHEVLWLAYGERGVPTPEPFQPANWRRITIYDWEGMLRDNGPPSLAEVSYYEVDKATIRKIVSGLEYQDGPSILMLTQLGVVQTESGGECRIAISSGWEGILEPLLEAPLDYHIRILDESGCRSGYYVARGNAEDELRRVLGEARKTFSARREAEEQKQLDEGVEQKVSESK